MFLQDLIFHFTFFLFIYQIHLILSQNILGYNSGRFFSIMKKKIQKFVTRFGSMIFSLMFFSTFFVIPQISQAAKLFSDVPLDHEYFEAISELEQRGVLNGFDDGTFRPEQKIVRASALKVVLMGAGIEVGGVATKNPFPDVPKDEWFASVAKKGQELKIVKGDGEGNFIPSRNVSRAEAVAMLFRTNGDELKNPEKEPFSDVALTAWYAPYFSEAKKTSLLKGDSIHPREMISRGELADLTYRFFRSDWAESELIGKASYYGDGFEGRNTASGEKFSNAEYLAAHRTLPFGTRLRVTHQKTRKSVIVRVVDRGPYVAGRVVDLSKAAFEQLVPLSSGISAVELEVVSDTVPLGPQQDCFIAAKKGFLEKDAFENITLFRDVPTRFRTGEVFVVKGKITSEIMPDLVTIFYGPDGEQRSFTGKVNAGMFSIPVYFEERGSYLFSVIPGKSGQGKAYDISVSSLPCEPPITEKTDAPRNFTFTVKNGSTLFDWDDGNEKLFRLEFTQKGKSVRFYVNGETKFVPPVYAFEHFEKGNARVKIWSTELVDDSFERKTEWAFGGEYRLFLTNHVSRAQNKITDIQMTETFSSSEKIFLTGKTTELLDSKIIVIDPDENIFEVDLQSSDENFSASFIPKKVGNYMIEVTRNDGLALFVGGVVPTGTVPVIPDYFDLQQRKQKDTEKNTKDALLQMVNTERKIRGLDSLKSDSHLAELAQFRADDMCTRNYFAHVDPDGKKAEDYRVLHDVQTPVGENIAKNSSLRGGHEGLMRSPAHRKLIIDPEFTRVGFGFCHSDLDSGTLTIVEIFGSEPFESSEIPVWREGFLKNVNSSRIEKPLIPSVTLESIAQRWAERMAKNNFMAFEYGEENLQNSLLKAGVTQAAQGSIFRLGNLADLHGKFSASQIAFGEEGVSQKNFLLEDSFEKVGFGIAQSETWEVYVVVLATREK